MQTFFFFFFNIFPPSSVCTPQKRQRPRCHFFKCSPIVKSPHAEFNRPSVEGDECMWLA